MKCGQTWTPHHSLETNNIPVVGFLLHPFLFAFVHGKWPQLPGASLRVLLCCLTDNVVVAIT